MLSNSASLVRRPMHSLGVVAVNSGSNRSLHGICSLLQRAEVLPWPPFGLTGRAQLVLKLIVLCTQFRESFICFGVSEVGTAKPGVNIVRGQPRLGQCALTPTTNVSFGLERGLHRVEVACAAHRCRQKRR